MCHTAGVPPHGLLAALNLALVDLCHVDPGKECIIVSLCTFGVLETQISAKRHRMIEYRYKLFLVSSNFLPVLGIRSGWIRNFFLDPEFICFGSKLFSVISSKLFGKIHSICPTKLGSGSNKWYRCLILHQDPPYCRYVPCILFKFRCFKFLAVAKKNLKKPSTIHRSFHLDLLKYPEDEELYATLDSHPLGT